MVPGGPDGHEGIWVVALNDSIDLTGRCVPRNETLIVTTPERYSSRII